jgi:hypothetical protein
LREYEFTFVVSGDHRRASSRLYRFEGILASHGSEKLFYELGPPLAYEIRQSSRATTRSCTSSRTGR